MDIDSRPAPPPSGVPISVFLGGGALVAIQFGLLAVLATVRVPTSMVETAAILALLLPTPLAIGLLWRVAARAGGRGAGVVPMVEAATIERLRAATDAAALAGLIETFIADSRERLDGLARAAARHDPAAAEIEAHNLGSNSATFGACRLAEAAQRVEEACTRGEGRRLEALVRNLDPILRATAAALAPAASVATEHSSRDGDSLAG